MPLHLTPGVEASVRSAGVVALRAGDRSVTLEWGPAEAWSFEIGAGRASPSYGVVVPAVRLLWTRDGAPEPPLTVRITPELGR